MRRRRKIRPCEFCLKKCHLGDNTVCKECDARLELQFLKEDTARAKRWAAFHKCRRCGAGLTIDRYFECIKCLPQDEVSLEDNVWDGASGSYGDGSDLEEFEGLEV